MRVVIKSTEDLQIGGYGYYVHTINGVKKFDYEDTFITAQSGDSGRLLAHDILEHALNIADPNLNELAALGAILAHRGKDFTNTYGIDGFAAEVAEQLGYYVNGNGLESIAEDTCNANTEYVDKKYEAYEDDILEYLERELEYELEDEELTDELIAAIHKLGKSYLSRGFNEVMRKDSRYRMEFSYMFELVAAELAEACREYDAEEFYMLDGKITLEINFDRGVEDYRITIPR